MDVWILQVKLVDKKIIFLPCWFGLSECIDSYFFISVLFLPLVAKSKACNLFVADAPQDGGFDVAVDEFHSDFLFQCPAGCLFLS